MFSPNQTNPCVSHGVLPGVGFGAGAVLKLLGSELLACSIPKVRAV